MDWAHTQRERVGTTPTHLERGEVILRLLVDGVRDLCLQPQIFQLGRDLPMPSELRQVIFQRLLVLRHTRIRSTRNRQ